MKNDFTDIRNVYLREFLAFYFLFYKDYSIAQLNSRLLELYQSDNPFNFIEISFIQILIAFRSTD